ncbi:hypothetical protein H4I95_08576 [Botrytis cinerea]
MVSGISFKFDPLRGRSNYIEWINKAKLFLEMNGFMPYIDGTETPPNKALYIDEFGKAISPELAIDYEEKLVEYEINKERAFGAIKSIISYELVERFSDKTTAKSLWDSINSIFGLSSFELMGICLNRLTESNYTSSEGMDEYINSIQSSYSHLKSKYDIPEVFIAWFLFRGLPSSFDGFVSRKYEELAKNEASIDLDKLFSGLISEEARMRSNFESNANKASFKNKNKAPYCSHCGKKGHLEYRCFKKHPKLKGNRGNNKK